MSALRCADVAELADALDSGSSGHCARAGSSPVIRSNAETAIPKGIAVFFYIENGFVREAPSGDRLAAVRGFAAGGAFRETERRGKMPCRKIECACFGCIDCMGKST